MDDDFGVGLGFEDVALGEKKFTEFLIVVDFPVENDPDGAVFVRDGLVAGVEVNDGQAAEAEADWTGKIKTFVVRATMLDGIGHGLEELGSNASFPIKREFSANAAH